MHLERFYAQLLAEGLPSATVLQIHRVLSRALKVAVQRGLLARNVCPLVDAPSLKRQDVEPLNADEARRLLQACSVTATPPAGPSLWHWDCAKAKPSRCAGPTSTGRRDDHHAPGAAARTRQGLVFVEPKSRAGRRTIMLPASLRRALFVHRQGHDAERVQL